MGVLVVQRPRSEGSGSCTNYERCSRQGRRASPGAVTGSLAAEASILKATLFLLERKPLRKVTVDAIAKRAGVSKATIYKWWPNKQLVALDAYLAG